MKEEDARMFGLNQQPNQQQNNTQQQHTNQQHISPQLNNNQQGQYQPTTFYQPRNMASEETNQYISKSKTNFVTAEGYDPNQKLKEIDRVLAASAVR